MHVVFVRRTFPGQFGPIPSLLVRRGFECTFVSASPSGVTDGVQLIQYQPDGATPEGVHVSARLFEDTVRHAAGLYQALKPLCTVLRPDLFVAHTMLSSTVFLRELFPDTPVINYLDYYCRPHDSDIDFRPEWPIPEYRFMYCRTWNAMILLELENCQAGYTPTHMQRTFFPEIYRPKIRVIHDGVATDIWRRQPLPDRTIGPHVFDPDTRIVTYVSRALESIRGFDIFMRVAKKIYAAYPRVVFLVVGDDRVIYGNDPERIGQPSFKNYVLQQGGYDLDRFYFLGLLGRPDLLKLFNLSDLHIYLTGPLFVSWSPLEAMACGCTVLGSDTAPVRELIRDGQNGLLRGFFDVDGLAEAALQVLADPAAYRQTLGRAAEQTIRERYSLEVILPEVAAFYEEVAMRGVG